MSTTQKERAEVVYNLGQLGIGFHDAKQLRRCAMTLRNWFEQECGMDNGRTSWSIERGENGEGKPYRRTQYAGLDGKWVDRREPIADREAGARKRVAGVMARYPELVPYVQGDPRGASLYVLRKSDVNGCEIDSVYTRGVAVY